MPLRIVHVGLGAWGRSWARSVLPDEPDVEVVAWVDPDPAARRQTQELIGAPAERCYPVLDEALAAHPADAVLATTSIPAHTAVALAALRAGKHVLLEKPFAPTVAEAAQVVAEAEERGLVLAICQNYRFFPQMRALAEVIRAGTLGPVDRVRVDFRRYHPGSGTARFNHELLTQISIHHFDLMRAVLGREPERISCREWSPSWCAAPAPVAVAALVEFEGGAVVSYNGSRMSTGAETSWEGEWHVECESGEVSWVGGDGLQVRPRGEPEYVVPLLGERLGRADQTESHRPGLGARAGVLRSFVDAVRTGSAPSSPGRDNLSSVALMAAARESSTTGRSVPIRPPDHRIGHSYGKSGEHVMQEGLEERLARFREWRFGLFVHWGLYSLAARHEWVMQRERLTDEQYRPYLEHFEPDLYDPNVWLDAAVEAGMRYTVLTTKHHEGFALWDSNYGDFTVRHTPWGKDLVGPFVRAARERSMGVGFYHSLIDWHHPDFPIDGLHPRRDDPAERIAERGGDIARYRTFLHNQVEELLTRFGDIDVMWFDFSYPNRIRDGVRTWGGKGRADWGSEDLLAMVRRLQPHILVNDRLDLPGDFVTPEQYQPAAGMSRDGVAVQWEACQTLNGSWGYDRDNLDWKPVGMLVRMLVDTVAKDGNLLLNVGPNARGEFDPRSIETLRGIGRWMRLHGRAIHGAGRSAFTPPADCRYTQRGNRLYLHLFSWPFKHLHLAGLADKVRYAQFLHDASEVRRRVITAEEIAQNTKLGGLPPGTLTLELPVHQPDVEVPVVELFLHDGA